MSMKRLTLTAICAGALIFTAACGGGGATDNTPNGGANTGGNDAGGNNQAVVTERPAVYDSTCLSCHGTDLEGRVGGNSNLQDVGSRLNRDEIFDIIANGKAGTNMPPFGNSLSEEEISELADWLASLQ